MAAKLKKPMPLHRMTDRVKRNDDYRYQIIPLTEDVASQTMELDGKKLPYGRSGGFMTDDAGVAHALEEKYGKWKVDVWDVKSKWHPSDKGHRYTFSNVDLPWKKNNPRYNIYGVRIDDEFGRLIRTDDIINPSEVQDGEKIDETGRRGTLPKDGEQTERQGEKP